MARQLRRRLKRRFNRNPDSWSDLNDDIREILRLVPETSPQGVAFQHYMGGWLKLILPAIDLDARPIRFLISDEKQSNAFFITTFTIPTLCFTCGLLQEIKHVEDICGIMGHEFTHHRFQQRYSNHNNTKLEEMTADAWPVLLLAEAGLDPRRYVQFVAKTVLHNQKEDISQVVDVHPTDFNRVTVLNDALAAVDKKMGGFTKRAPRVLPHDFSQLVTAAHHTSYIEHLLNTNNFSTLSNPDKLRVISTLVDELQMWSASPTINVRVQDLTVAIRSIKTRRSVAEEKQEQDLLTDKLLSIAAATNAQFEKAPFGSHPSDIAKGQEAEVLIASSITAIYRALTSSLGDRKPLGRLKLYEDDIYDFIEAKNYAAAFAAANSLMARLENEPVKLSLITQLVTLPSFELPEFKKTRSKTPVPWDKFIAWGQKDKEEAIAAALLTLGVVDPRIFEYCSGLLESSYTNQSMPILFSGLVIFGDGHENIPLAICEVDEDGFIHLPKVEKTPQTRDAREQDLQRVDELVDEFNKDFLAVKTESDAQIFYGRYSNIADKSIDFAAFWIGLAHAEKNFELFIRINFAKFASLSSDYEKKESRSVANKLLMMVESGDPQQLKIVRGLYMGFKEEDPLYTYSFERMLVTGFVLPVFSDESSSPLLELVINNPFEIFTIKEQLHILARMVSTDNSRRRIENGTITESRVDLIRKLLGYTGPQNGKEFVQVLKHFSSSKLLDHVKKIVVMMLPLEFRLLIDRKRLDKFPLTSFIKYMDIMNPGVYSPIRKFLEPRIAKKTWPEEPEELAEQWTQIYKQDLFPNDLVLCYQLLRDVIAKIKKLTPTEQVGLYELFLFGHRLKDPGIRTVIENLWIQAHFKILGKDTGASEYTKEVGRVLARMREHLLANDRVLLASKLADKLETQEKLTKHFKDSLQSFTKEELEGSLLKGMALETALLALRKTDKNRNMLMEYLIQPLTTESTEKLAVYMELELKNELYSGWDSETGLPIGVRIAPARIRAELKFLWENFWTLPFAARALAFEQLLFSSRYTPETGKPVFDYVKDKLFPASEPYVEEARLFVNAYFEVIPDYQHPILMSAMMVTTERSSEESLSIGQRLAMVLELLGPAETKLGQVIHSHPKTPKEIKDGMGRLKSKADPPARWDLLQYYRDSVPAEVRKRVLHVGSLLGSASFYLALEVEMKNHTRGVMKLLRPFAAERAENGFEIMLQMVGVLQGRFDPAALQTIGQMIRQAQESAVLETNRQISVEQAEIAAAIYDGRRVTISGESFDLHVPKIISYGPTYQFMEKAPGKHFNDLPDKPQVKLEYKRRVAMAYFVFELATILRGGRFDFDRHGAQMRVQNQGLYLFDWGGMALQLPTQHDREQLGAVVFDIYMATQAGTSLDEAILSAIQNFSVAGVDVDYLLKVQKALLALEDFRKYLSIEQVIGILVTLLQHNVAHQDITNAMINRALQVGLDMEQIQEVLQQQKGLDILLMRRRR